VAAVDAVRLMVFFGIFLISDLCFFHPMSFVVRYRLQPSYFIHINIHSQAIPKLKMLLNGHDTKRFQLYVGRHFVHGNDFQVRHCPVNEVAEKNAQLTAAQKYRR
jgi:hypothetical protein